MSYKTASPSSSRSTRRPALPPSLHLTIPQENDYDCSNRPGGSKLTIKSFSQVFHHIVFPGRFGTASRLERVAEATVEDENAVYNNGASHSIKRKITAHPTSRPSTSSIVSQSTASHISTRSSRRTLITSFPPLNVSDIPPRSPTNKSPFSAVLLAGEDEEHEEDDPTLALWHTEQLHRARLAKLTRHLGEEIPAELVLSPAFLSHSTSRSFSRRGSYHHKRRSLDPSAFMQESSVTGSTEGILRRSKSLREQGDTRRLSSMTGIIPEMPCTEYTGGVRSVGTTTNTVPISDPVLPASATPETRHLNSPINISNDNILRERVSMYTYSDRLPSHRPPVETSSEVSPSSLCVSRAPSKSRTLPRRPATADASRRAEKLADFFGVDHDDVSTVAQTCGTAQKLQFSSTSSAGDLQVGIGIHAPTSQLEVEVKVSKPTRFWNGRATTQSVHPDDVMDRLRMMKAS